MLGSILDTTKRIIGDIRDETGNVLGELGGLGAAAGSRVLTDISRPGKAVLGAYLASKQAEQTDQSALSQITEFGRGAVRGFLNPNAVRGIDVPAFQGLPDTGPQFGPFHITPKTLAGFGAEVITDPLNYIGAGEAKGFVKGLIGAKAAAPEAATIARSVAGTIKANAPFWRNVEQTVPDLGTRIGKEIQLPAADFLGNKPDVKQAVDRIHQNARIVASTRVVDQYAYDYKLSSTFHPFKDKTGVWFTKEVAPSEADIALGAKYAPLQVVLEYPEQYGLSAVQAEAIKGERGLSALHRTWFDEGAVHGVPTQEAMLEQGQNYISRKAEQVGGKTTSSGNAVKTISISPFAHREIVTADQLRSAILEHKVTYASPSEAFRQYTGHIGKNIAKEHESAYMKKFSINPNDLTPIELTESLSKLRAAIHGVGQTLVRRVVRGKAVEAELGRVSDQAATSGDRWAKASMKLNDVLPSDVPMARRNVTESIEDARKIAGEIGRFEVREGGNLSKAQRATVLEAKRIAVQAENVDAMFKASIPYDVITGQPETLPIKLNPAAIAAYKAAAKLDAAVEKFTSKAALMEEQLGQFNEASGLLKHVDENTLQSLKDARAGERQAYNLDAEMRATRRELRLAELDSMRQNTLLAKAGNRSEAAFQRATDTSTKLTELRNVWAGIHTRLMDSRAAAKRAMLGREQLSTSRAPALRGEYFDTDRGPGIFSKLLGKSDWERFNGLIEPEQKSGAIAGARKLYMGGKAIDLPIKWTLDAGSLVISGFVSRFSHPFITADTAYRGAKFAFNDAAWVRELETKEMKLWKMRGGPLDHPQGEFAFADWFDRVPGVGPFAKFFKRHTALLRAEMAYSQVDLARRLGHPLDAAGEEAVVRAVSRVTGRSVSKASDIETLTMTAPSYTRAAIETVVLALRNDGIESELARKYLSTFVIGAMTTVAAVAYMQKRDLSEVMSPIDPDALKQGELRYNYNFGSVRAAGQDISLFGKYASLAALSILSLNSTKNAAEKHDLALLMDPITRAIQSLGDPITSFFGDAIVGSTIANEKPLSWRAWAERFAPQPVSQGLQNQATGLPLTSGLAGAALSAVGERSNPLTPTEELNKKAQEYGEDKFSNLTGQIRKAILDANPDLANRYELNLKQRAVQDANAQAIVTKQGIDQQRIEGEKADFTALQSGQMSVKTFADQMQQRGRDAAQQYIGSRGVLDVGPGTAGTANKKALTAFYDLYKQAEITPGGPINWDKYNALEAMFRSGLTPEQSTFIDGRLRAEHAPEVAWFFKDKKVIEATGYWKTLDVAFERFKSQALGYGAPTLAALVEAQNQAIQANDKTRSRRLDILINHIQVQSSQARERMRMRDPVLDQALHETTGSKLIRERKRA